MKLTAMPAALAAFAVLTGCESPTPTLLSLEPAATAKDAATDSALVGTWQEQGDKFPLTIIRPGDKGYQIALFTDNSVTGFQAQLFRVGDAELLDLTPTDDNDFRIPGHAIVRIWTSSSVLRWAFLDSDWLKQRANALASHTVDGKMQLFSSTDAVRAFIDANGANDQAYGKVAIWERVQ